MWLLLLLALVLPGIDVALSEPPPALRHKRIGLITHMSAVDAKGLPDVTRIYGRKDMFLAAIFTPEHGLFADRQGDVDSSVWADVPVHSLYGPTKKPTPEMLKGLDTLVFDMQDVGVRFYTYIATMQLAMQAAKEADLEFVVLDRPNPLGGVAVEGNILQKPFRSFTGPYELPVRHGMTIGELANLFNQEIGCKLTVVPMKKWRRHMWWDDTGLAWKKPSPAMLDVTTASVYPGICFFEATNVNCRVGDRPFEKLAAPWLNGQAVVKRLPPLPGIRLTGKPGEISLTVVDRKALEPVRLGLHLLTAIRAEHPKQLTFEARGFDRLAGGTQLREALLAGKPAEELWQQQQAEARRFIALRRPFLIYD